MYFPGGKVIGHDTTVIYGENATLLCQLTETDDDLTRIIWKKKTREKLEESVFFVIRQGGKTEHKNGLEDRVQFIGNFAEKNGSIQLFRMRLLDEGIYTCTFNLYPSGPLETDINVTVFGKMLFKILLYISYISTGHRALKLIMNVLNNQTLTT
uniref:Ig-like domain-containing protein n=1 Tax=Sinocyclocheilus grahami TaxID=75366 RepID=A0A672L1P2_SINGR